MSELHNGISRIIIYRVEFSPAQGDVDRVSVDKLGDARPGQDLAWLMHSIVNMPIAVLLTFTVPFLLFVLAMSHMSPFVGIALIYLGLVVFIALWSFVGQRTRKKPRSTHSGKMARKTDDKEVYSTT